MFGKLVALCLTTVSLMAPPLKPPELQRYTFSASESKILPGKTQEIKLDAPASQLDRIGRLALISLKYHNSYWIDGRYNHNEFPVEWGMVTPLGQELHLDAFRIAEPLHKASQFLGSQHGIYYRFPTKADWSLYQLDENGVKRITTIPEQQITQEQYTKIEGLTVSKISGNATFFWAPATVLISNYPQLNAAVEAAKLADTPLGPLLVYRHRVDGLPPDPHRDKPVLTRQFFPLKLAEGPGLIWQDTRSKAIILTRFKNDMRASSSITLAMERPGRLLAACADPAGNLYCLLAREKDDPEILELVKTDPFGKLLARQVPDSSKAGLNIFSMRSEAAELAWSNGQLAMMLMRTMHKSPDGLNHQGGIAAIFDANDLKLLKNLGQTSGHSFDNVLTVNNTGEFIGIDLGDNYPRGIHLHKLADKSRISRVVYTFKTHHGMTEKSPAGRVYPPYPEISTPDRSYYKWSNDNGTYTELGGIVETPRGYLIVFAGEPSPEGKVLDNSRIGANNPDMRNIGLVVAVKTFSKVPARGSVVPDELLLTKGLTETGGFYSFGGAWSEQRTTGVVWLTHYTAETGISARHIKTARLPDGATLILWETAHKGKHHANWAMTVTAEGQPLLAPFRLPDQLALNRRDAVMVDGSRLYIASGDTTDKRLELFVLQLK